MNDNLMQPDFRAIFEGSPNFYLVLRPDLTIAAANDVFLKACGLRREEIVGRNMFDVFPDTTVDVGAGNSRNIRESLERVLEHRHADSVSLPTREIKRTQTIEGGGEELYWCPLNTPVLNEHGDIDYIIHQVDDVFLIRALFQRTEQLTAIVDTCSDAVIMINLAGAISSWNRAAAEMFGYSANDVIGAAGSILAPDDRSDEYSRIIGCALRGEDTKGLETVRITRTGERLDVLVSTIPVRDAAGTVVSIATVVWDIRERKQAETQIRELNVQLTHRAAELEAANAELEAFSYSVSHDLRSPLRTIDGFSLALLEDHAGNLDDTGKDYLERVRAAAQRMGLLIDDMLALSRIARSDMTLEVVDLSTLAHLIVHDLTQSIEDRKVSFDIQNGLSAYGNSRLLRLVMENLLGNAVKYTAKREYALIQFGASQQEDNTKTFYMRDNGAGFDPSYAHKLFRAFQRLHSVRDFPGNGIGLAIVARILHRHGGRVWAEGVPEQGATFYFSLPNCD